MNHEARIADGNEGPDFAMAAGRLSVSIFRIPAFS
jgi:hypothetical protein